VRLDREWISARIPHAGRMCLLDEVLDWSADGIRCRSGTHRRADNPLRAYDRLGGACAIEYAAQAIAVHGALVAPAAGRAARSGYLASLRDVTLGALRLDDIDADLICEANRIAGDGATVLYEFSVAADGAAAARPPLASGRAAIVLHGERRFG